jgi:hypothetical protein
MLWPMSDSPDLASLIRQQVKLEAVCQSAKCRTVSPLNLSSLASRMGSQITLAEIVPRVRCEKCRGKKVELRAA